MALLLLLLLLLRWLRWLLLLLLRWLLLLLLRWPELEDEDEDGAETALSLPSRMFESSRRATLRYSDAGCFNKDALSLGEAVLDAASPLFAAVRMDRGGGGEAPNA